MIVVVMGVSGCGKSSLGQAIATEKAWRFIEGDDLHPDTSRRKMADGIPLTDDDRWPWLDRVGAEMARIDADGESAVVACSALRQVYRDRLRRSGADIRWIHLTGAPALIAERLAARQGHFMPPALLQSQFATLEPAGASERITDIDIDAPSDILLEKALSNL